MNKEIFEQIELSTNKELIETLQATEVTIDNSIYLSAIYNEIRERSLAFDRAFGNDRA